MRSATARSGWRTAGRARLFFEAARSLLALADHILEQRPRGNVWGFALGADVESASHRFGDLTLTVRNGPGLFARMLLDVGVQLPEPEPSPSETRPGAIPTPGDDRPFGIVIRTGPDRFIVAGQAALFDFAADDATVEIDEVRELVLDGGEAAAGPVPQRRRAPGDRAAARDRHRRGHAASDLIESAT